MPPFLALAVLLAQAAPAAPSSAPADQASFTDAPGWLRLPTRAEKLAAYPRDALARHMIGQASIDCVLDADGYLRDCRVAEETPQGQGFGPAALALARAFRMTPLTSAGASVAGGRVTVPIQFAPTATRTSLRLR